ncbi:hypothetical protein NQ315_002527, partial [Exocentrus adspersus]
MKVLFNLDTVGRPPGSKTKTRLEMKWAQQIAQGIPSPSSSPPLSVYPTTTPSDTSSNESSLPDKQLSPPKIINTDPPPKKLKILKPVITVDKKPTYASAPGKGPTPT